MVVEEYSSILIAMRMEQRLMVMMSYYPNFSYCDEGKTCPVDPLSAADLGCDNA